MYTLYQETWKHYFFYHGVLKQEKKWKETLFCKKKKKELSTKKIINHSLNISEKIPPKLENRSHVQHDINTSWQVGFKV